MKFVCENCKAKYQIGDEKVAGKTLRMKCRRCGHMIQVAAAVTESSVSTKLPTEPVAGSVPQQPPQASPSFGRPLEDPPDGTGDEGGATIVRPSPLFLFEQQQKSGPPRPVPVPAPSGLQRPRPSQSGIPPAPRIVPPARASMRSSPPAGGAVPIPRAPLRSSSGAAAALAQNTAPPAPTPIRPSLASSPQPSQTSDLAHSVSAPALYGGFVQAVQAPSVPAAGLPTEDWYVGIAGVPLGPVRLSVIREKAAQGQVDMGSLAWREGYDEWLPIRKIPGLCELVEEAKQGRGRASATPIPAAQGSYGNGAPFASPSSPGVASAAAAAASRTGLPIPEPATSQPFDLSRPSGVPQAAPSAAGATESVSPLLTPSISSPAPAPDVPPTIVKDPFAPAPAAGQPAPETSESKPFGLTTTAAFSNEKRTSYSPSAPPEGLPGARRKGLHPMAWAFIAMAAAFGAVAAWALFLRKPDVVYLEQAGQTAQPAEGSIPTGAPTETPSAEATADATTEPVADASSEVVVVNPKGAVGTLGGTSQKSSAASTSTSAPIDTSGFGMTPAGPKTVDTGGGGSGGGPLSAGEAQGVVAKNTPRVRRNCWDPQVQGRSADAPSSVKVTATLQVAPDGSVKSANVSGGNEKHFPGLVGCVKSAVSSWKFPPSGEGGTVVVPFGFNAQ